MKSIFKKIFILLLLPISLFAFPDSEKGELSLVSSQADQILLHGDDFLFVIFGDDIERIDLETWALATEQVPELTDHSSEDNGQDLRGDVKGIAIRGSTLFATQADGDLIIVDLSSITSTPTRVDLGESVLGAVVADSDTGTDDDKLYIADETNKAILVYDISEKVVQQTISLVDSGGNGVVPVALAFAQFPSGTNTTSTDTLYVTSDSGIVFFIDEGASGALGSITLSVTDKSLPSLALTPERNFLLVTNSSDTSVHVIDTSTDTEVGSAITLPQNGSLNGIAVMDVTSPSDTYAYVTGSNGLSVIDLNISGGSFGTATVIDFNDEGTSDTEDDPLTLSTIPGPIVAASSGEEKLYTSLSNAEISLITEVPFVTIGSTSLTTSLTSTGTFTVTFQSDETGTYSVRAGGDLTQNGVEVATGTVSAANTDTTTSEISYSASTFSEGTNRIFVFVTDDDSNIGRDAIDITVDTPPSAVTITGTSFGTSSVFVTFNKLDVSDVSSYSIYVDKVDAADATIAAAGSVSQPTTETSLTSKISGLDNGDVYFVGVEAVDAAGNIGPRTTTLSDGTAASATPEATVGIAGFASEAGCTLIRAGVRL